MSGSSSLAFRWQILQIGSIGSVFVSLETEESDPLRSWSLFGFRVLPAVLPVAFSQSVDELDEMLEEFVELDLVVDVVEPFSFG